MPRTNDMEREMESQRYHTPTMICPACESNGGLSYVEIPESVRTYRKDDAEYQDYFGEARDFRCQNCSAEFTLTNWDV